jgi:hypothetical protein
MIAPAAMFVEMANDHMKDQDYMGEHDAILNAQMKEVQCALPGMDISFYAGYMIGIETARVLLAGMPAAVLHKVEI